MTHSHAHLSTKGLTLAAGAYVLWGFLPVYLKQLGALSPLEILAHRVVWALTFCAALVTASARWGELWAAVRQRSTLVWFALSAATLAANWLIYIWAVNTARVVEGSLGYFITPLINAGLGVVVLHERLRLGQWVAFALGGVGVGYLGIVYGQFPVVGLALALTFGVYGLLRKRAVLDSLLGLTLETALAAPLALAFLLAQTLNGNGAFIREGWQITLLLLAAGPVTAMPLLLFAAGARHIPLSTLGMLQYIGPTLQFLLGVLAYGEPLTVQRFVGFAFVWSAMIVFALEGQWQRRRVALEAMILETAQAKH
ncbi:MAG: EamA family transporter RarD [Thermoflexales bacterium]|nr:EamA family transporter RarD [Thermoflexales bacterium]